MSVALRPLPRTRTNPFATDWPWVEQQLQRDPALQAKTLFGLLCERAPERYSEGQLRTFQRHVITWRALHGSEREVIFEQVHQPDRLAQSDFTHMDDLNITLYQDSLQHPAIMQVLVKPFTIQELLAALRAIIGIPSPF